MVGFLLTYYMICAIALGPPVPMILSLFGLNPLFRILENLYLMPDQYSWEVFDIIKFELVSLVLLSAGFWLFIKYLFVMFVASLLVGVSANAGLQMVTKQNKSELCDELYVIKHYEMILMVLTIIKELVSQIGLFLVVFALFFLTILAWLSINCYQVIPAFVTFVSVAAFIGGICFAIFLLTLCTNARLDSMEFVERKREEFNGGHFERWSKKKYVSRKWNCLQPLPIYCGSHFAFSKNAIINFADILSNNITNAILLVLP